MIKEIEIEGNRIHLRKSVGSWRVVHPIKINGKINWKNLISGGNWMNPIAVSIVIIVIIGFLNEYVSNLRLASACLRALPDSINLQMFIDNPLLNYTSTFTP
jgi:hypothetical protein